MVLRVRAPTLLNTTTLWTPVYDTSNLVFSWVDISDTTTLTDVGGGVISQINDKVSGTWTQATSGKRGTRTATNSNFNNKPTLTVPTGGGYSGSMTLPQGMRFQTSNSGTSGNGFSISLNNQAGGPVAVLGGPPQNGVFVARWNTGENNGTTGPNTNKFYKNGSSASIDYVGDDNYVTANGGMVITASRVNGMGELGYGRWLDYLTTSTLLNRATWDRTGSNIDLGEIIVLSGGNVSDAVRQLYEGYLAWKWGLQTSLPTSHPYYYAAPTLSFPAWDVTRKYSSVSLTNAGLTVKTGVNDTGVYGTVAITNKTYWEMKIDNSASPFVACIGVANSTYNVANHVGSTGDGSIGVYASGTQWLINQTTTGTASSFVTGDVVSIAVDPTARLIWMRVNGGNWNGSSSNDPATGVGGQSFSSITGTLYPVHSLQSSDQTTARFTTTSWTYAAPAGYYDLAGTAVPLTPSKYGYWRPQNDVISDSWRSITIAAPVAGDSYVVFQSNNDLYLQEIKAVIQGSGNVVFSVHSGTNRGASGNTILASMSISNTTYGNTITVFPGSSNTTAPDSNRKPANWTFSNNNLTVTGGTVTTDNHTYVTQPVVTGRYYAELRKDVTGGADGTAIGMVTGYARANGFISNSFSGFACWETGGIQGRWANNLLFLLPGSGATGSITTALNDKIQMAVDMDSQLVWMRVNGSNWNANASADPVTGLGGASFAHMGPVGTPMYLAWNANLPSGAVRTLLVPASSWAGTPPAGYKQFPAFFTGAGAYNPTVTLNPNDADTSIILASNFTTAIGAADFKSVRTSPTFASPTKVYFEAVIVNRSTTTGSDAVGIANSSASLTGWDANAILASIDSQVYKNSVSQGNTGKVAVEGDVIGICFDASNGNFWCRVNGGNWNNSGTANPAIATGAIASGITGPFSVIVDPHTKGAIQILMDAQNWRRAAPIGFGPAVAAPIPSPTVPANSFVWVSVSNTVGTVSELHVTMRF